MKNIFNLPFALAARLWLVTATVFAHFMYLAIWSHEGSLGYTFVILFFIGSMVLSGPAFVFIAWLMKQLNRRPGPYTDQLNRLILAKGLIGLLYAVPFTLFPEPLIKGLYEQPIWLQNLLLAALALFLSALAALLFSYQQVKRFLCSNPSHPSSIKPDLNMEQQSNTTVMETQPTTGSQKIMVKGLITALLILALMIPTVFIANLVEERHQRQKAVAEEVSSKWAGGQSLSGPFISVPYQVRLKDAQGKESFEEREFVLLPETQEVKGKLDPEIRARSIYKVLLYHANINQQGLFNINVPKGVDPTLILWRDARICLGLSDIKGIESRVVVKVNNTPYELTPGLPSGLITKIGVSAPIDLRPEQVGTEVPVSFNLRLKGSEQLHFIPLSGNSNYSLQSAWPSPSFDGNALPSDHKVSDSGFYASWSFNKANLPFSTVINETKLDADEFAFGVTMVQPADQYAKTDRSVKYAILVIGLSFALFFIIELMQKKPVHPVQYVLIGLALVIFYTLLLSISEFLLFDIAYMIAAVATILLVTLYAKSHFGTWRVAGIFFLVLGLLYGFIFVLIRLEDTALLVGSIGLFVVLALVMYASRKVDWYGTNQPAVAS
ncbi:cell envelope integrity protein CreD [Flavihumibacter rivuli]|uniref:cell envelope integrity protein CreD n=1 Tax=Flavihumibacter rivuli TaxID=2838156 RepID=UPI001BDE1A0D|nr:cell envelope integrity protein CreD [Flavihumibacter rivuli]ULQ54999.1 cell envelope integrity protein CreD [Flavihumibacter rivuli]